ncbi:unnamed protein product [Adineta ricciae]|uniref:Cation efflux protein transmembrane domain-containing protein n=1 Tax=Adineta ricciae TaxID=249248 RepID=A0A814Z5U5_ADIRI|nr:unnamed protein product [Adineta ricciae]
MSLSTQKDTRFYSTKTFRLVSMMILTFSYFVVELVVGNITNSLALVADAFHMLSDLIALAIGLIVVRIAKRRSNINTFGWVRAEVVGANINSVFLLALCLTIIFDTIKRYIQPEPIENPTLLLIVGSVGLGINIIGLFLFQGFHGHSHGGSSDADEPHGHSHHTPHESKLRKQSNRTSETNPNTATSKIDENIEPIEVVVTSSDFRRHSLRALDETDKKRINFVPCLLQAGYEPSGYLGLVIRDRLYIDFTAPGSFDASFEELMAEIHTIEKQTQASPTCSMKTFQTTCSRPSSTGVSTNGQISHESLRIVIREFKESINQIYNDAQPITEEEFPQFVDYIRQHVFSNEFQSSSTGHNNSQQILREILLHSRTQTECLRRITEILSNLTETRTVIKLSLAVVLLYTINKFFQHR